VQGVGFAQREELCEEHCGTFVPRVDGFLVLVEPLFHLSHEGEEKQMESDGVTCDSSDDDGLAELKEVLQMSICILVWLAAEWASLHHFLLDSI
jgi:hypothetical protein